MVIAPERDRFDSFRFVIEMGKLENDATLVAIVIGIMVVPGEVVVVVVVDVSSTAAIDDIDADVDVAVVVVVVVVAVTICDSLVSIVCFGCVVNIDVANDTDANDDSCALTVVVVAMDDDGVDDDDDGCLTSNVG